MNLKVVSIAVAVALSMLGAVLLANPADLGISPVAARWLAIIAVGLGILQGFLPRLQGPTTDPDTLVDRIWGFPMEDRERIARDLADRAEREIQGRADDTFVSRPPEWDIQGRGIRK